MFKGKSALLVGASGLIGSYLLPYLLNSKEYERVITLVRDSVGIKHEKLEEHVIDFEKLAQYKGVFKVNDVFCTLGTTMKKAKSRENFKRVDFDYPLELAKLAKENKVDNFLVVTSMGANPNSRIFYSRLKGQLEERLKMMGLNSLHLFRPSLLLGKRKEFRFGEETGAVFAKALFFIFYGPLRKYKPITGQQVAYAMYRSAQTNKKGVFTYQSHEIVQVE